MQACAKLKLLNGPLAGRELLLPEGSFTIGRKDCDLLLPLEQDHKASLALTPHSVTLNASVPCWVDGVPYTGYTLPFGRQIDLAGICFILGDPEAKLSMPPLIRRIHPLRRFILLIIGLLCLGGAGLWVWFWWPPQANQKPTPTLPLALNLSDLLPREPGLQVSMLKDRTVVLGGRCQHSRVLSDIMARIQSSGLHLQQNVICNDDLVQVVHNILTNYGYYDANIHIDAAGHAIIESTLYNDQRFKALSEALDRQPGLTSWKVVDRSTDELKQLITALQAQNLLAGVSANHTPTGWILTGQLSANHQNALQALLTALQSQKALHSPARFVSAINVVDLKLYFPAPITGLGGNARTPFLELSNGMRLQVGSALLKNMRIIDISNQGISISDGRQLVFISLNG